MEVQRCMFPTDALMELITLQLQERGRATLTVTGNSMYPMLINCRDQVELIPASHRQNKKDVILYRRDNGKYILHRIVALTQDGYICCGDNQYEREFVRHDQLLAVVDGFTRNNKQYTLSHLGYRLYTALSVGLFPIRKFLLRLRHCLGRLRRMFGRNGNENKILYIICGILAAVLVCVLVAGLVSGGKTGNYFGDYKGLGKPAATEETTEATNESTNETKPDSTEATGGSSNSGGTNNYGDNSAEVEDTDIKIPIGDITGSTTTESNPTNSTEPESGGSTESTEATESTDSSGKITDGVISFDDLLGKAGD